LTALLKTLKNEKNELSHFRAPKCTLLEKVTSIPWAARLSWLESAYLRKLFHQAIFTCKLRQTDLAFGVWSRLISRSVQARLQVSVCSGYDLCHAGWHPDTPTVIYRQHFDQFIWTAQPAELINHWMTEIANRVISTSVGASGVSSRSRINSLQHKQYFITQRRSIAKSAGCFQRCLSVCVCVCLSTS